MSRGNRDTEYAGEQEAYRARQVGRKSLEFFQLYHIHSYGFDDLLSSHACTNTHNNAAQEHEPHRDQHALDTALPVTESDPQKQNADKLLAVLSPVHEAHESGSEDLRPLEKAVRLPRR